MTSSFTIIPEVWGIIGIMIARVYGTLYNASLKNKFPILTRTLAFIGIQISTIEAIISIGLYNYGIDGKGVIDALIIDGYTVPIKIIIVTSAISSIGISITYIKEKRINKNEWVISTLMGTLSSTLLISSFDLISIYSAIELQSSIFYTLAAYNRNDEFSTEAGLKYFILGALASGILLFGTSIIYGITGITNLEEITKLIMMLTENEHIMGNFQNTTIKHIELVSTGLTLVIIAILFKISAVPFHMWAPDVYEGAPLIVTALSAITPKIAIIGILVRLCLCAFHDMIEIRQDIIILSAILSMFIGTFGAIKQKKMIRLIAYSGIAHIGYISISIGTGTIEAIEAMLIYIIAYVAVVTNILGIILITRKDGIKEKEIRWVYYKVQQEQEQELKWIEKGNPLWSKLRKVTIIKEERKTEYIKHLTDLSSLSETNPILAITMGIILFPNAGIPPLAGFYGKSNVFLTAIENGLYLIAIASVICSVIGAFYSIRSIKIIWYDTMSMKGKEWKQYEPISRENGYIITTTFLFTITMFLAPSIIFIITHEAAIGLRI